MVLHVHPDEQNKFPQLFGEARQSISPHIRLGECVSTDLANSPSTSEPSGLSFTVVVQHRLAPLHRGGADSSKIPAKKVPVPPERLAYWPPYLAVGIANRTVCNANAGLEAAAFQQTQCPSTGGLEIFITNTIRMTLIVNAATTAPLFTASQYRHQRSR
jgi:hypothetical protein